MFDITRLFGKYAKPHTRTKFEITTIICMSVFMRNFEEITNKRSLQDIAKLMQQFYGLIASATTDFNADIDRFCHNQVLIYFKHDINHAEDHAIKCGHNIISNFHNYDESLDIGVGICKGEIIYGIFGSETRATVTGFGPVVNTSIELSKNKSGVNSVTL